MARLALGEKSLVVAMDHAQSLGAVPGLEDPVTLLDRLIGAGADGIMTSFRIVKQYRDIVAGRVPVFLRLDGGPTALRESWLRYTEWSLLHGVEDARRLGVDGVCVMYFLGSPVELRTAEIVARVASECAADGLPVMVEALPCPSDRITDALDAGVMATAARIAFEHGADIVKTYYTGDADSFATVTRNCPVPVLIAGGSKMENVRDALEVVHGAMRGGARGVVMGRNIWQDANPPMVVRALRAIIHDGATVDGALAA